jgi:hypothetical protein
MPKKRTNIRKVSREQSQLMDAAQKRLVMMRGIVIHSMTEIESLIDDLILDTVVRKEAQEFFLEVLAWPELTMSLKTRLVENMPVRDEFKLIRKHVCKQIRDLAATRNKFAHRLSLMMMDTKKREVTVSLIVKKDDLMEISEQTLTDFAYKCAATERMLTRLIYGQKGLKFPAKEKRIWLTPEMASKIDPFE